MMDLDPEARRLLELTREARTPSTRDKERVGQLLAGALTGSAVGVASAGSSGVAGKAAFTTALAKWAAVALVAASGAAGILGWRASKAHSVRVTSPPAETLPAKNLAPPEAPGRAVAPVSTAAEETSPGAAAPATHHAVPSRLAEHAVTRATTLPEELDLLHEAQAAWRGGRAGSALELLARHRATYPRSELTPERDALTVLCLCATGRTAEAQKLARRFLKNAHGSPLRASVEESCAKDR